MYFNVLERRHDVAIKAQGESPIRVPPSRFYTVAHGPEKPGWAADVKTDLMIRYDCRNACALPGGVYLLDLPRLDLPGLNPIPRSYLWPYVQFIDGGSTSNLYSTCEPAEEILEPYTMTPPAWTVGTYCPKVVAWGIHIDYTRPRPTVVGLYFAVHSRGPIDCRYYGVADIIEGCVALHEHAQAADVFLTNSGPYKYKLLMAYAERIQPGLYSDDGGAVIGLETTVEDLVGVAVPGLNWAYPSVVEAWARDAENVRQGSKPADPRSAFAKGWETDFACYPIPADPRGYFAAKIAAWLRVSLPILATRMQCALELGIDLRCTLDSSELAAALVLLRGISVKAAPASFLAAKKVTPFLAMGYSACVKLEVPRGLFYVYDALMYLEKRAGSATYGQSPLIREATLRAGDIEGILRQEDQEALIGMFDYGVIFWSGVDGRAPLEGVRPLFIFQRLGIWNRGVFGLGSGGAGGYGYGAVGLEGARTPAFQAKFSRLFENSDMAFHFTQLETAYMIQADPFVPQRYLSLCTPGQHEALTEDLIPIPLTVWKGADGRLSSRYNPHEHDNYHGGFFPGIHRQ
jgi:hypothetical protein